MPISRLTPFEAPREGSKLSSGRHPHFTYLAAGSHIMRHATQSRIGHKTICGALLCALVISASFTGGAAQLEDQAQRSLLQSEPHTDRHCRSNSDKTQSLSCHSQRCKHQCTLWHGDLWLAITCSCSCLLACCFPGLLNLWEAVKTFCLF